MGSDKLKGKPVGEAPEEQEREPSREREALYNTGRVLAQSPDPETGAAEVCRVCVEAFGLALAWLSRAESDGSVTPLAWFPPDHPYPGEITVRWDDTPAGRGPSGTAIRSGIAQICDDAMSDPRFAPWHDTAARYGLRSSAALPLASRGRTFGALALYSPLPGFFTGERVALFQALAHQAAALLESARLLAETERRLSHITALRNIDSAITGSLDRRLTLRVLLDEVTRELGVDAAAVLLYEPHSEELVLAAGRGFRRGVPEGLRLRLGEGLAGRAAELGRALALSETPQAQEILRDRLLEAEGFRDGFAAPMVAKGKLLGVLVTWNRGAAPRDGEWREFLEALASQAAIAIDNAGLYQDLEHANRGLRQAYDATILGWSRAVDLRDKETEGHSERVTELTLRLARFMGMDEEELVHVRRGALLHDVGKLGVPDAILLKPGPLTDEEWEVMRRHPQYAFEMLAPIDYLRPALDIPYCHHERWDGTGYPRGLVGEQIPLAARIFALADVWDALTSVRPYRPAWSTEKALAHIHEQASSHFDPRVVEAFFRLRDEEAGEVPSHRSASPEPD